MQMAIALHQSCWLGLSVSRMILCSNHATEKQPEYDGETIFHCSEPPENRCKLLCTAMAARAYPRVLCKDSRRNPEPQAFTAITSRYSDETTVSSSPPR